MEAGAAKTVQNRPFCPFSVTKCPLADLIRSGILSCPTTVCLAVLSGSIYRNLQKSAVTGRRRDGRNDKKSGLLAYGLSND